MKRSMLLIGLSLLFLGACSSSNLKGDVGNQDAPAAEAPAGNDEDLPVVKGTVDAEVDAEVPADEGATGETDEGAPAGDAQ